MESRSRELIYISNRRPRLFESCHFDRWLANPMTYFRSIITVLINITLLLACGGCVKSKISSPDYSRFPQIDFLPTDQARPVTSSRAARTQHGELPQEDWSAIVDLLSRLPEEAIPDELEIINISAENMWQTVSVTIQIGGNYMVVFVKVNRADWLVAGIHEFQI